MEDLVRAEAVATALIPIAALFLILTADLFLTVPGTTTAKRVDVLVRSNVATAIVPTADRPNFWDENFVKGWLM